jgi:AAHS family 4-hydroxybenzoate transporter-like MFS transporter
LNWPNSTIFLVVAIPAIVSAVMVFAMRGGPQTAAKG